jgi:hypothetical protein
VAAWFALAPPVFTAHPASQTEACVEMQASVAVDAAAQFSFSWESFQVSVFIV